jgi:HSP20 family molecular chaperone IbpA
MSKRRFSQLEDSPPVETFRRGGEFIIRADLVNMDFSKVTVEHAQDAVIIVGQQDYLESTGDEPNEGLFDSFWQVVRLPDDAIAGTARASFRERVIEITVQTLPS